MAYACLSPIEGIRTSQWNSKFREVRSNSPTLLANPILLLELTDLTLEIFPGLTINVEEYHSWVLNVLASGASNNFVFPLLRSARERWRLLVSLG